MTLKKERTYKMFCLRIEKLTVENKGFTEFSNKKSIEID